MSAYHLLLLPDTREGGSIPITSALEKATGMSVLLLPIGAADDMAHSQNEKYNISNLVNGIKVSKVSETKCTASYLQAFSIASASHFILLKPP